jgi:hypothetical protein
MKCSYCGSGKHTITNCAKTARGQGNRRALKCSYCGETGHNILACPKTWNGSAARRVDPKSIADHYILDHKKGR